MMPVVINVEIVCTRESFQWRHRHKRDRAVSARSTGHSQPLPANCMSVREGERCGVNRWTNLVVTHSDAVVCSVNGILHTVKIQVLHAQMR